MTRSLFYRLLVACAFGVLSFSRPALASDCYSVYSSYESCVNFGSCSPYSSPAEYAAAYPQCFPGGSAACPGAGERLLVPAGRRGFLRAFLAPAGRRRTDAGGQCAGAGHGGGRQERLERMGQRGRKRYAPVLHPRRQLAKKNDVDVTNSVVGIDYAIAPGMVLGVSGAFDRGAGSSQATAVAARQASTITGYAIAPYIGYQLSKEFALDASIGFGAGNISGAGNMESEGDRLFYAANLNYSRWVKDLQFSGKLGYLHGEEDFGLAKVNGAAQANTASKSKMDRWMLGVQAGYWLGNGVQPYAGLSYLADRLSSSQGGADPIGKSAWQWALGLNFFSLASGVTGGVAYTQEDGRSNQKNSALSANIGMRF
jgi:hypothetical protein